MAGYLHRILHSRRASGPPTAVTGSISAVSSGSGRAQRDQYRFQRRAMRAIHSWPIVMVIVGVVFLLVRPSSAKDHSLGLVRHWWPLLLVVAGSSVGRVGTGQADAGPNQPYARRSIAAEYFRCWPS